jgi:hypothetical protein
MPPSPDRSVSALSALPALNSSMQSKLAIGALHLKYHYFKYMFKLIPLNV